MRSARTHLLGILPHCHIARPRPDSGRQTHTSLSSQSGGRNKLVTCDAIHCNAMIDGTPWPTHHRTLTWRTDCVNTISHDFYDLLVTRFTLCCNSCPASQANHLARCKKHHQSTSAPVNARTNYAAKDRDRPARLTKHSPLGAPGSCESREVRVLISSGNINYWHPPLSLSPGPNNVAKHVSNIISDTSHIFHFREERIYNFISVSPAFLRWH